MVTAGAEHPEPWNFATASDNAYDALLADAPINANSGSAWQRVKAAKRRRRREALTRAIASPEWSIGASVAVSQIHELPPCENCRMPLYHRCGHLHQPGAFIQPGNWGKIVTGRGPRHNQYLREYAFERIRDREFSDKPSRVACVFAFEDDAFAKGWTRGNPPEPEHVYLVDTLDPDTPTLRVDMAWIDVFWQYHSFEHRRVH